jgi:5,10-methylenetetrahydromethanopterin reductase
VSGSASSRVPELWTLSFPPERYADLADQARAAEEAGWDGWVVNDSATVSPDPYVSLAVAAIATRRIGLGTAVTNPVTRDLAVTASAISAVQELSGGRAVLGMGRGDSAVTRIGRESVPVHELAAVIDRLRRYLDGDPVTLPSGTARLEWLDRRQCRPVPLDVAASGPRVIAVAAPRVDRLTLLLGTDPDVVRPAVERARQSRRDAGLDPDTLSIGSYVLVAVDDNPGTARALLRASAVATGRFVPALRDADEEVMNRMMIAGPPEHCVARMRALVELGIRRLVVIGRSATSDPALAASSTQRFVAEVMPALRAG